MDYKSALAVEFRDERSGLRLALLAHCELLSGVIRDTSSSSKCTACSNSLLFPRMSVSLWRNRCLIISLLLPQWHFWSPSRCTHVHFTCSHITLFTRELKYYRPPCVTVMFTSLVVIVAHLCPCYAKPFQSCKNRNQP